MIINFSRYFIICFICSLYTISHFEYLWANKLSIFKSHLDNIVLLLTMSIYCILLNLFFCKIFLAIFNIGGPINLLFLYATPLPSLMASSDRETISSAHSTCSADGENT